MIISPIHVQKIYNVKALDKQKSISFCSQANEDSFESKTFFPAPKMPKRKKFEDGILYSHYEKKKLSNKSLIKMVARKPSVIPEYDLGLFARAGIKLTKFDTDEIIEIRRRFKVDKAESFVDETTSNIVTKKELDKLSSVPQEGKLIVVCGLAGAGKNTYIEQKGLEGDYYLADVDVVKDNYKQILGEETYNKYDFHPQSRYIMQERILKEAFENRRNIVLPTTGLVEYVERLGELCKKYQYQMELVIIDTDVEKAIERSLKRQQEDGFFTDPVFVYKRYEENKTLEEQLHTLTCWNKFSIYDNNFDKMHLKRTKVRILKHPKFSFFKRPIL